MDPLIIVFGLGVGVLIGMTGIGGGSLMTPLLIIFAGIQPTVAIGTDLAYGSIPGVLIGSQLVMRVPTAGLRPVLGCVLLGSALGVLTKAGVAVPVGAIVGVPVAVGVLGWALGRTRERMPAPVVPSPERA